MKNEDSYNIQTKDIISLTSPTSPKGGRMSFSEDGGDRGDRGGVGVGEVVRRNLRDLDVHSPVSDEDKLVIGNHAMNSDFCLILPDDIFSNEQVGDSRTSSSLLFYLKSIGVSTSILSSMDVNSNPVKFCFCSVSAKALQEAAAKSRKINFRLDRSAVEAFLTSMSNGYDFGSSKRGTSVLSKLPIMYGPYVHDEEKQELFWQSIESVAIFRDNTRNRVVSEYISTMIDTRNLQENEVILDAFILHTVSTLARVYGKCMSWSIFPNKQLIWRMKEYVGEKITLSFVEFFVCQVYFFVPVVLVGFILGMMGFFQQTNGNIYSSLCLIFGFTQPILSLVWNSYWMRKKNELLLEWGITLDYNITNYSRPEAYELDYSEEDLNANFKGVDGYSPITNRPITVYAPNSLGAQILQTALSWAGAGLIASLYGSLAVIFVLIRHLFTNVAIPNIFVDVILSFSYYTIFWLSKSSIQHILIRLTNYENKRIKSEFWISLQSKSFVVYTISEFIFPISFIVSMIMSNSVSNELIQIQNNFSVVTVITISFMSKIVYRLLSDYYSPYVQVEDNYLRMHKTGRPMASQVFFGKEINDKDDRHNNSSSSHQRHHHKNSSSRDPIGDLFYRIRNPEVQHGVLLKPIKEEDHITEQCYQLSFTLNLTVFGCLFPWLLVIGYAFLYLDQRLFVWKTLMLRQRSFSCEFDIKNSILSGAISMVPIIASVLNPLIGLFIVGLPLKLENKTIMVVIIIYYAIFGLAARLVYYIPDESMEVKRNRLTNHYVLSMLFGFLIRENDEVNYSRYHSFKSSINLNSENV